MEESNFYDIDYKLHSILKFKFTINEAAVKFIQELKNKYNIIIMTTNPI